ncbi:hypothetical protein TNCT_452321 [Trichonephila clavata]|uniref:Uncharacterized protein n=1 Tax=Trichonephila clavata TaxID=2740835 RepID=A0A8X6EY48_TRICU|nr:hypothetical protein TNCT_450611 [Trichonephila clavata]GFQ74663.1 hypothetical protein TNCT_452321 [Trichonephila clavata]
MKLIATSTLDRAQRYVFVCEQLAKKRSVSVDAYVEQIVPKLFSLAWDIVPNVRLALSRCIALTLLPLDYLTSIQKTNYDLPEVLLSLLRDATLDHSVITILIRRMSVVCACPPLVYYKEKSKY